MIDRTQEDINQDKKIASGDAREAKLDARIAELERAEQAHRDLLAQQQEALSQHEDQLHLLDPLKALVKHVESIMKFIKNARL